MLRIVTLERANRAQACKAAVPKLTFGVEILMAMYTARGSYTIRQCPSPIRHY